MSDLTSAVAENSFCTELELHGTLCALAEDSIQQTIIVRTATEIGNYNSFSGMLAAIAFACLIISVANPPKAPNHDGLEIKTFALSLVFAFLLLSTFMFIPLTGTLFRPTQEIGLWLSGSLLALAVCELFLCLTWLFVAYSLPWSYIRSAVRTFYFIAIVVILNYCSLAVNAAIVLQFYYPEAPFAGSYAATFLLTTAPVGLSVFLRLLMSDRAYFPRPITVARAVLYASMFFALVLVAQYVFLFSEMWDRNNWPFLLPINHFSAFLLGVLIGGCILALPRQIDYATSDETFD